MYLIKRSELYYYILLILLILAGCHSLSPKLPGPVIIPESYNMDRDTISIGFLPRKNFFTDTNLVKLIDTAVKYNFDLQRAIQRIEIARANLRLSKGRFLPGIAPGISAGVDKYGDYTMNGVGNFDSNLSPNLSNDQRIPDPTPDYFIGLRSAWEISLWGNFRNQKKAAYARFLSSETGKHLVTTTLVSEIAALYYDLLALDNELLTIRNNIILQQTALEMIKVMKEGARANELAVRQFQAQLLDTQGLEVSKQQDIIRSENKINLLLGRFPQPIIRGKPIREQIFPANTKAGLPSSLLNRRPDIRQAELELTAAHADVKAARAAFFPTLTISAYSGFNSFKTPLLFTTPASLAYGALTGLTAPLFNRNLLSSNFRRGKAEQMDAYYAYQKTIVTGFQEVVTNLNGIKNYEKIYNLKEQEVENLLKAVTVSKDLYMTGYATYLEVITAQKSVLQAELELSEVKKDQFISLIELYRSLGGGWQ
jgi:multidrug efflux system outer membrane protein